MIVVDRPFFESMSPVWEVRPQTMLGQPHEQPVQAQPAKRRLHRRPGACEPCRASKLGCDGGVPCSRCSKKSKKRNRPICYYKPRLPRTRGDGFPSTRTGSQAGSESSREVSPDPDLDPDEDDGATNRSMSRRPPSLIKDGEPYGHFSMAQCIDLFKSLLDEAADSSERSAIRKCSGVEVFDNFEDQGIQQLKDSSMPVENDQMQQNDPMITEEIVDSMSSNLKEIYRNIISVRGLISSGSVVKAWMQVPGLVKLTQKICGMGMRRGNSQDDLNANEVEVRRRIWWLVMDLEVQISTLIGQPLNVSKRLLADMERPTLDDLDENCKRLQTSKLDLRETALEILSKLPDDTQAALESKDYDFLVEHINMDRFELMLARMPNAQPGTGTSKEHVTAVINHRIEFLAFKMLLSCVLAVTSPKEAEGPDSKDGAKSTAPKQRTAHMEDITSCARRILDEFETWYQTLEVQGSKNWTTCLYAFSAAVILTITVLRKGVCHDGHFQAISKVHTIFCSMAQQNPSSIMMNKVCTRIGALVGQLKKLKLQTQVRARKIKTEKSPRGVKHDRSEDDKSPRTAEPPPPSSSRKRRNSIYEAATDPEAKRKKLEGDFYSGGHPSPGGTDNKFARRGSQPALFPPHGHGRWSQAAEHEAQLVASSMPPYMHQPFGVPAPTQAPAQATTGFETPPGQRGGYWYDARWNEANIYPPGWFFPPLARPMPPFQLVDDLPYANQYAGPMGEDMSFAYSQDGTGRRFQQSAGSSFVTQNGEQPGLTDLAPGWHEPLQSPIQMQNISNETGFENAAGPRPGPGQGPATARPPPMTRQQSAAAAYVDSAMAAQTAYQTQYGSTVFSQSMSQPGINTWHEAEDGGPHLDYAAMNFMQQMSQESSSGRPQVSRSWSDHGPSGAGYNMTAHTAFQPFHDNIIGDERR